MAADLALIVPTRGRPGNISKVLEAWDFTGAWDHAQLVVAFDADDPERDRYVEVMTPRAGQGVNWMEMPRWLPMVHKLDEVARVLAGSFFALGFAGDDHLPRTIGWVSAYLTALRDMGSGTVYGDDGYQGAKLCTEWAMTSDIVRALGRMVPAPVEHMYSDVSLLELMQAAGMVRHLPQVRIEHMHPIVRKAENDEQYRRVNSREQFSKDRLVYHRWRRREMGQQLHTLRTLNPADLSPRQPARAETPRRRSAPMQVTPRIPRRLLKITSATPNEIGLALADMAGQVPAEQAIVELGVYHAKTTLLMSWGARAGNGAHVWGIDPWELAGNTYGEPFATTSARNWARHWVRSQGFANHVTLVQGFSLDKAATWDGPPIGLLFIDADHSYEGARADVLEWSRHLADRAIIAVDDYGHPDWPGVKEAVDDLVAEGVLEPVQIFHDRLAVTRLRIETAGQSARLLPEAVEGDMTEHEHPGTGQVMQEVTGEDDGTGKPCPPPDSVYAEPVWMPDLVDPDKPLPDPGPTGGWTAGPAGSWAGQTEPAGKGETVDLDPPPVPTGEPEPAGKTEPVDLDPDPHVAVAYETVLPGEIKSVPVKTTLDRLNVAQLRELAQARHITLGRGRKTREAALAALRAGR